MANSVQDTIKTLRQGMGAVQADALGATLDAILDALENIATKLDADGGVTATNFASTTAAIIDD